MRIKIFADAISLAAKLSKNYFDLNLTYNIENLSRRLEFIKSRNNIPNKTKTEQLKKLRTAIIKVVERILKSVCDTNAENKKKADVCRGLSQIIGFLTKGITRLNPDARCPITGLLINTLPENEVIHLSEFSCCRKLLKKRLYEAAEFEKKSQQGFTEVIISQERKLWVNENTIVDLSAVDCLINPVWFVAEKFNLYKSAKNAVSWGWEVCSAIGYFTKTIVLGTLNYARKHPIRFAAVATFFLAPPILKLLLKSAENDISLQSLENYNRRNIPFDPFNEYNNTSHNQTEFPVQVFGVFKLGNIPPDFLRVDVVPCGSSNVATTKNGTTVAFVKNCLAVPATYNVEVNYQPYPFAKHKKYNYQTNVLQIMTVTEAGSKRTHTAMEFCRSSEPIENYVGSYPIDQVRYRMVYYPAAKGTPGVTPGIPHDARTKAYIDFHYVFYCPDKSGRTITVTYGFKPIDNRFPPPGYNNTRRKTEQTVADWDAFSRGKSIMSTITAGLRRKPGQLWLKDAVIATADSGGKQVNFIVKRLYDDRYGGGFINILGDPSEEKSYGIKMEFDESDQQVDLVKPGAEPIHTMQMFPTDDGVETIFLCGNGLFQGTHRIDGYNVTSTIVKLPFEADVPNFAVKEHYEGMCEEKNILVKSDKNVYLKTSQNELPIKINKDCVVGDGAIDLGIVSADFGRDDLLMIYPCGNLTTRKMNCDTGELEKQLPFKILPGGFQGKVDLAVPPTAIGSTTFPSHLHDTDFFVSAFNQEAQVLLAFHSPDAKWFLDLQFPSPKPRMPWYVKYIFFTVVGFGCGCLLFCKYLELTSGNDTSNEDNPPAIEENASDDSYYSSSSSSEDDYTSDEDDDSSSPTGTEECTSDDDSSEEGEYSLNRVKVRI
jgi:hypothetical protein